MFILAITVLELPPKESCSSRVSLEFLYGMWVLFPSTKAEMTFPSTERDWLIFVASFRRVPAAWVLLCLSDPWRNTNYKNIEIYLNVIKGFKKKILHLGAKMKTQTQESQTGNKYSTLLGPPFRRRPNLGSQNSILVFGGPDLGGTLWKNKIRLAFPKDINISEIIAMHRVVNIIQD